MFRFVKNVISASVIVIIDVCVCVKAIKKKKKKKKSNRIGFDVVTPFVYTAPVEFVIRTDRFEYAFKSGAFSKRYGFTGRVNSETASI